MAEPAWTQALFRNPNKFQEYTVSMTRIINHEYAPTANWTCICRPDDLDKTLVNEAGSLLYDFAASAPSEGDYWFNSVFSFGLDVSSAPVRIEQSTESAHAPIVRTRIEYPNLVLELLTFAHTQETGRVDIVLWTVSTRGDNAAIDTAVWVEAQVLGRVFALNEGLVRSHKAYTVNAAHRRIPTDYTSPGLSPQLAPGGAADDSLAMVSNPQKLRTAPDGQFGPSPRLRTDLFTVRSDHSVSGSLIFPLHGANVDTADFSWASAALQKERRFWSSYKTRRLTWLLPDADVMDMVTSSARNIMQAREPKNGGHEFQVGPTCYRGLWVVDGHFILEAARYLGHKSAGVQGIEALKKRVAPDGSIAELPFHHKETGISIATLIRQCELDDDWERLESLWDIIRNGVNYIRSLREASKEAGESAPEFGLMPATFGDGGLGGMRAEYTTALWTLVGLKWAARAAQKLGFKDDSMSFTAEFQDLLRVFRQKANRDMGVLPDGSPYLPMAMPGGGGSHVHNPELEGEIDPYYRINPGTATWALAQAIYPGEVFADDDPIVLNLCHYLDQVDDEEGVPANTGWLPHNAVWNYSASFYAHVWLYVGRPDKAIDYLYAFANHSSPTRVWREEQSLRSADYEQIVGDMPHNWASAEFVRLTRHLLVFERGDSLEILRGLPGEWIRHGESVRLEKTPTRYGPVDLTLDIGEDGTAIVDLGVDTEWSQQPRLIRLFAPIGYECVRSDESGDCDTTRRSVDLPFTSQRISFKRIRKAP